MMMQVSIGSAVMTAVGIGMNYYQQRQQSRRREQLLILGMQQANIEWPAMKRQLISTRQLEMETLLANVRTAADGLVAALACEEQTGAQVCAGDRMEPFCFPQWESSRRSAEQAHEDYNRAVQEYREFVHSLAPPQRAEAAKLGCTAMTVAGA
jgi:hypothetical protein